MSARILVVDDEDIVIRSALRVLASEDYALDQARDGAEALRSIEGGNYDVVILDIMMPKVDGIEVLQRVKESHPDIEVIMFTGLAEIDTAVRCMKLGAFDYIAKPFEPDELRDGRCTRARAPPPSPGEPRRERGCEHLGTVSTT